MVSQPSRTRVIIFTPALLMREAWRALLSQQPFIETLVTACTVGAVQALVEPGQPTTILLDLPGDQPQSIKELRTAFPDVGLLVMVEGYDLDQMLPLLRYGVTGFISRDSSPAELARALIAAGRRELVLPPSIAGQVLRALTQGYQADAPTLEALSEREGEVLELLALGMTNKDIAQHLILSVRTVEAHLRSIYSKLDVSSRTEAVLWAVRNGYTPPE